MDKFGIFNLLNSFLNLYSQNSKPKTSDELTTESPNFPDLSKLFSNNPPPTNQPTPQPQPINPPKPIPPLQANMLSTIRAHDEFVKRVKQGTKS